jgi:hypothetical protein
MNIEELKDRKDKLERDMGSALEALLNEFCAETDQSPSDIAFITTECRSFGIPKTVTWDVRVWAELKL